MVAIHGGAYEVGSSMDYANFDLIGHRFVSTQQNGRGGIVFVSIQYRLGVMGKKRGKVTKILIVTIITVICIKNN